MFPPRIQTHFDTETLWYPCLPHANLCIFHLHTNFWGHQGLCAPQAELSEKYKNTAVKFQFQINNGYNLNMSQILHCCCSVIKSCLTICNPMNCTMPGFPVHHYLPEFAQFMSIESVMPSNHLILCRPLLLLPLIFPSIRAFSNELALHIRWPKY